MENVYILTEEERKAFNKYMNELNDYWRYYNLKWINKAMTKMYVLEANYDNPRWLNLTQNQIDFIRANFENDGEK